MDRRLEGMTFENPETLVNSRWLAEHLSDPDIRILDCTWHHVSTNLDGRNQYRGRHLPRSIHFDIDHFAQKGGPLPHMLPSEADFAKKVGLLGIGDGEQVYRLRSSLRRLGGRTGLVDVPHVRILRSLDPRRRIWKMDQGEVAD